MHPELMISLVAERHRDLAAALRRQPPARTRRAPRLTVPRFSITWSRTVLQARAGDAASGRRGARSLVIVLSATRTR